MSIRQHRAHTWSAAGVAALSLALAIPAAAASPITDRVSVTTGGFAVSGGDGGEAPDVERRPLSHDGRFVAFVASAPLVKGQGKLDWQVLVRDRMRGTTELVSATNSGDKANGRSWNPSVSTDGRIVVFESEATNLVAGDTNGTKDIFVHDRTTGQTTRVSVATGGVQGASKYGSYAPSLSADGRFIAFNSYDALAPGIAPDTSRAFLHDRVTGTTELVSVGADGLPRSTVAGTGVSVSGDGARVLFVSLDSDVTPDAHNLDPDVFLRNRATGATTRVAGNEDGARWATISADGVWAAYESPDSGIVAGDTNDKKDVFLTNLDTGEHRLVSRTPAGASANHESLTPAISADGRYVVFESHANDLVTGDTNGIADVFRYDATTGAVERINVSNTGSQSAKNSYVGGISGDGQHVTFQGFDLSLSNEPACCWNFTYVRDLAGTWPAMRARVTKMPKKSKAKRTFVIRTAGIASGERVTVTWAPKGKFKGRKGKKVVRAGVVRNNKVKVKAAMRVGKYVVRASYDGRTLKRTGTVRLR